MKRILAICGIVLLVSLYVITFILALFSKNKAYEGFFNASVYMTFIIPALLYVYTMIYKLNHRNDSRLDDEDDKDDEANGAEN